MNNNQDEKSLFWTSPVQKVFNFLDSSEKGLKSQEARTRLQKYGFNEIAANERRRGLDILISQFKNSLILVLIAASVIAYFLDDRIDAFVILSIVMLNAILGFFQEYRAENALRALKKYLTQKANVLREGEVTEINAKEIVPGDVVFLDIGDMIPADIRLIKSEEMTTDESSLTGESLPVVKTNEPLERSRSLPQQLTNIAFMGTSVASGSGHGMVITTGKDTFFGKTASILKKAPDEGDFQKNIRNFSNFLLKVIIGMTAFIFITNALLQKGIFSSFLFALALAVGLIPEALPIIITIALSRGALEMAKQKVIIKRLAAVEDFGNIDTLCCDKTGTLTEGEISLSDYVLMNGKKEERLILYGLLCNSARHKKGNKVLGNPMDKAIWQSKLSEQFKTDLNKYEMIKKNEFDFERKIISVMVRNKSKTTVIAKGAVESILPVSSSVLIDGKIKKLSSKLTSMILTKVSDYEKGGYRILAIATRETDGLKADKTNIEKGLNLEGFLLFLDQPKKAARNSLKILQDLEVEIKVISGDSPVITRKICNDVGLIIQDDRVITGDDLAHLNKNEFKKYCHKFNIFARVTPEQKYKIVASLRKEGHIVGFLGDGINDVPALKAADVGISVNTASNIAKEAADIILLQKSLHVLSHGIIEGRRTFANITKYILNTISANYGNMFTVASSSLFLKFIPLLPSQILLNNFISDIPLLTISTDNVDKEFLRKPRRWDIKLISKFMIYFGAISTFFDLALILALIFIIKADTQIFRTAWFLESALSEIIVTFSIRTRLSFFKSMPSRLLLVISVFTGLITVILINTLFGNRFFEFVRMPLNVVVLIALILVSYFITIEVAKKYFFKKYEI